MSQFEARKRLQILYQAGIISPTKLHIRTGLRRSTIYDTLKKIKAGIPIEHAKGEGSTAEWL